MLVDGALRLYPGCVVFKIGVTTDPIHRFFNKSFGYANDKDFEHMIVLCKTDTAEAIGFVEAALISKFKGISGCRNIGLGGENIPSASSRSDQAFFCYLVYRVLPRPPGQPGGASS
jgi:hypothetical protein